MISCIVASTKKTDVYKYIQSITLPAYSGKIQVLPGHVESFILLQKGNIILQQAGEQSEIIEITDGECYFKNNKAIVIL